jgi:uridine phosphorylase
LRLGLSQPDLIDRLTGFSYGPHRITNFEMETAGIYGLGKILGHSCLSLSVVVANRITRQFSREADAAMEALIQRTLGIVEGMG